ncbi:MAG: hypothetical protein IJH34_00430 [Romboutsia sp.]|nr:hypothetical protein [Romboutsia sp.]
MSDSLFFDDEEFLGEAEVVEEQTKYTTKVNIPQYEPSDYCPSISEMMDTRKYEDLVIEINESSLPDEEKRFLRLAATRHIVFNYSKVADYYVHANKEMQELLEHSAMVIIDFNDALANGLVKLENKLTEMGKQALEERNLAEGKE